MYGYEFSCTSLSYVSYSPPPPPPSHSPSGTLPWHAARSVHMWRTLTVETGKNTHTHTHTAHLVRHLRWHLRSTARMPRLQASLERGVHKETNDRSVTRSN